MFKKHFFIVLLVTIKYLFGRFLMHDFPSPFHKLHSIVQKILVDICQITTFFFLN